MDTLITLCCLSPALATAQADTPVLSRRQSRDLLIEAEGRIVTYRIQADQLPEIHGVPTGRPQTSALRDDPDNPLVDRLLTVRIRREQIALVPNGRFEGSDDGPLAVVLIGSIAAHLERGFTMDQIAAARHDALERDRQYLAELDDVITGAREQRKIAEDRARRERAALPAVVRVPRGPCAPTLPRTRCTGPRVGQGTGIDLGVSYRQYGPDRKVPMWTRVYRRAPARKAVRLDSGPSGSTLPYDGPLVGEWRRGRSEDARRAQRDAEYFEELEDQARAERRTTRRAIGRSIRQHNDLMAALRHDIILRPPRGHMFPVRLPRQFTAGVHVRSVEWDRAENVPVFTIYADLLETDDFQFDSPEAP